MKDNERYEDHLHVKQQPARIVANLRVQFKHQNRGTQKGRIKTG